MTPHRHLCLGRQDDLADGAGPSGDQQDEAPQPNALEQEAAAAVRPDEADCKKPSNFKAFYHT